MAAMAMAAIMVLTVGVMADPRKVVIHLRGLSTPRREQRRNRLPKLPSPECRGRAVLSTMSGTSLAPAKCNQCDANLQAGAKFCGKCGKATA